MFTIRAVFEDCTFAECTMEATEAVVRDFVHYLAVGTDDVIWVTYEEA